MKGSNAEAVCHDEQMTVWTGEIAGSLSMGGYLREDLSYDDKLDLHAVIANDLRDIVGSALTHPSLPPALAAVPGARPLSEWSEEDGDVLWWRFPIEEPPFFGSPLSLGFTVEVEMRQHGREPAMLSEQVGGWPGYHTHWTPIQIPPAPCDGGGASRQDAQRLDPKDDSAVDEASSEVEAPDQIPTLKAEIERLKEQRRLMKRGIRAVRALARGRQRKLDAAEAALAESERKRVEDIEALEPFLVRAPVLVDICTMKTSAGVDYYVRFRCDGREVTPHMFKKRYQAEYTADHYAWVFGLRPDEPDLMTYGPETHLDTPTPTLKREGQS